ncbi:hypothetical protein EDB84DRAFT_22090 [Lactarius hengduanensis]|nr:hypothetical protein EDB84DRAFT_22090 [Lactarius hengduanensis]
MTGGRRTRAPEFTVTVSRGTRTKGTVDDEHDSDESSEVHPAFLFAVGNLFLRSAAVCPLTGLPVMPLSVIRRNVLLSIVAVSIVAVLSLTILYTLTDPFGHLRLLPLTSPLAADATLLVVCEDSDLGAVLTTMQQIEDRFNAQARYPWTFLCDEPLTEDFKTTLGSP